MTPIQIRLSTIKLEIESADHVLAVIEQQKLSPGVNLGKLEKEITDIETYKQKLIDEAFELEILIGDSDDSGQKR